MKSMVPGIIRFVPRTIYCRKFPKSTKLFFCEPLPGFHSLFGKSGIGKTTLARIICGMEKEWKATEANFPEIVLYCHSRERLPLWQSVRAHLKEVVPREKKKQLHSLMAEFALSRDLLDKRPNELSSGQHNRFNLLRYLNQNFDLLLIDEALNNVDEPTRLTILAAIKKYFPDKGFLYISHQLSDVISFSKSLLLLHQGKAGTVASLKNGLNLNSHSVNDAQQLSVQLWEIIDNA